MSVLSWSRNEFMCNCMEFIQCNSRITFINVPNTLWITEVLCKKSVQYYITYFAGCTVLKHRPMNALCYIGSHSVLIDSGRMCCALTELGDPAIPYSQLRDSHWHLLNQRFTLIQADHILCRRSLCCWNTSRQYLRLVLDRQTER